MNLNGKIAIILVLFTTLISSYLFFIWRPQLQHDTEIVLDDDILQHLTTVGNSIFPYILNDHLGSIHENLDTLMQSNSDWVSLSLSNTNGERLYPVSEEKHSRLRENWRPFEHDIVFLDEYIGTLNLIVDYGPALNDIRKSTRNVSIRIIFVQLAIILTLAIILNRLVTRPVVILATAAKQMAKQNFESKLPPPSSDEIGTLSRTFESMRNDILAHQEELEKSRKIAEDANNAKNLFLSSMSHELRTPLNSILGFGQILEMQAEPLSKKQLRSVQLILKSGEHLLELINDILDFAKFESGAHIMLSPETIEPIATTKECIEVIASMADKFGVNLEDFLEPEGLGYIIADRIRFKQVLINFLSNAIKYNSIAGSVRVELTSHNDNIRISVTDTGAGIPKKLHSKLFLPFNRLGMENLNIEGTGIGLTISKGLVERMGGTIGFTSTEGQGSTFWFELPVSAQPPPSAEALISSRVDMESLRSQVKGSIDDAQKLDLVRSILYIEDNEPNIDLMKQVIKMMPGTTLHVARSAEEGLEMVTECLPNLILMDINLPGMNGIEALAQLRNNELLFSIPVVAITAAVMNEDKDKIERAEFNGHLTKPINIGDTLNTIERLTRKVPQL